VTQSNPETFNLATPEEIIEDARNGRMYILVDAEDRENEGDLIIPAQFATPDAVNFMAKHGRGLICLAMEEARAEALGLRNMSADNKSRFETAFTQSIEAREGVTTGISAGGRVSPHRTYRGFRRYFSHSGAEPVGCDLRNYE